MNVEIENEVEQFPETEYINGIFLAVWKFYSVISPFLLIQARLRRSSLHTENSFFS